MQREFKLKKVLSIAILLILIPLVIAFGTFVLDDKRYFFISLMIIVLTIISFVISFEKRKPKARELVLIAVLSSIAVIGRMAFFMIPQFKPVMAIVIIAGVSLGGEAGFLTGALAALVSNFFFGQGAWTPWQIFSFGISGFISGLLFYDNEIRNNKALLCIYGGIVTVVLYGGITNLYSFLMVSSRISLEGIIAIYISAIPFDVIHAISTVFFLFVAYKPMLEKIDRIKIKYGLLQ